MSTVLVCMASEYGGVNGSLPLALELQKAGWRIVYTGTEEIGEYVRAQGLEHQLLLPPSARRIEPAAISRRWLASRVSQKLTRQAVAVERLVAEHGAIIDRVRPDVTLVDPVLPILAVAPLQRHVPVLGLNPTYAECRSAEFRRSSRAVFPEPQVSCPRSAASWNGRGYSPSGCLAVGTRGWSAISWA